MDFCKIRHELPCELVRGLQFGVKEFFVFRLEVMRLFGTAYFNKPVIRHSSIGILARLLFQVKCSGLRIDSWKYKTNGHVIKILL
jgi:hypothetical protein